MSNKLYEENDIQNIANAIRSKNGTENTYKVSQMSTAINSIEVIEQATAEGESLSLANTKAMPYNDYVVEGKSEQDGEPSPSNPSEIHSVADDVNLLNRITCEEDKAFVWTTGATFSETNSLVSDYINVKVNQKLIFTYNAQILFYDSSKTYLGCLQEGGTTIAKSLGISTNSLTVPNINDIYYMRLGFRPVTNNNQNMTSVNIKLQKGSTATPYSPYNQGTVTIKQRGKNLIDNNNLQYDYSNVENTYNKLETIETGIRYSTTYSDGGPIVVFNTGIDLTNHIGKTIKMKSTISSNAGSISIGIANADTSLRQNKVNTNISNKEISFLVTDDLGEKKYLIYYLTIDVGIGNTSDFKNLTLTIDEEPIYEPYQTPYDYTIQTEPLRSLPNGVKDTIEADGIHRRVGRVVLDGSENWDNYTAVSGNIVQCRLMLSSNCKSRVGLSDRFLVIADYSATEHIVIGGALNNAVFIHINKSRLSTEDITGFKTWLSTHNLEVLYPLAEEVIEPLTQNQATTMLDIIKTGSYEGTTNIYTDEDVKPTIGVEYYKKS